MKDYRVSLAALMLASVTPAAAHAQAAASETVDEVVVTGSRIARQDYSASTPISTISAAAVEKTGAVTLDTALKQRPQFVGSTGSTTNSNGNGGQANVQLRGLGRQRTLVLMDGRRLPPANSDGSVDINVIPSALIENVEVITGGASAIYGSDAVAGVVNIRMKHHFSGLELDAQYGAADNGDAEDYKISVALGGDFAEGRGNSVFSAEYANRNAIFIADRGYSVGANRDAVLPTGLVSFATGAPSQAALDAVFGRYGVAAGVVRSSNSFGFNPDGTLFTTGVTVQNFKQSDPTLFTVTPTQVLAEGRQYRFLQLPLETYSFYNRTSYALTEGTQAFMQLFYSNNVGATQGNPVPSASNATTGVPLVPVTNPFIPADLRTLLASRASPTAGIALSKRFDALGGGRLVQNNNHTYQAVAGVEGRLPIMDWKWDFTGSYGKNEITTRYTNYVSRAALQSLLSAPDGGASICAGGFNPFGNNPVSKACADFIAKRLKSQREIEQRVVEGNVQGRLFALPAGDLRFAIGADYREDHYREDPDALIASGDTIAQAGAFFEGRSKVKEGYAELLIPIVKDLPFVKELSVDVGARISDYDTIGSVATYKADGSWKVVDQLTLRGGYERAIRAPSLGELYTPVVNAPGIIGLAGSLGSGDPCDIRGAYRTGANGAKVRALCLSQGVPQSLIDTYTFSQQSAGTRTGGNAALKEETADTFSIGAVWRPTIDHDLFRNVSLSVDYYSIKVKDAVGSITPTLTLSRCFNASGATNPAYAADNTFCQLVTRNPDGTINLITGQSLNLGAYKTAGVDVQLDWRFDTEALGLPDGGSLSVNLVTSWLDTFKILSLPGDPYLEYAGTIGNGQIDPVAISRPKWKSNLDLEYQNGPAMVGVIWRFFGKMDNAANVGATNPTAVGVSSVSYFDLTARYRLSQKLELWGVVTNLTDKLPPVYPAAGSTDLATYDVIGRRFTLGVKARF